MISRRQAHIVHDVSTLKKNMTLESKRQRKQASFTIVALLNRNSSALMHE
jgi:hypothetical protein